MTKEPIFPDKVHLLMEETGCDQGEAELALASVDYDLEKAVRTIAGLLRHIVALKGKFQAPGRGLYGLLVVIADTRRAKMLRTRAVVSYDPALFETPLAGDWYDVEKSLYGFRLGEGALQQVSQDLERLLSERWETTEGARLHTWLREAQTDRIKENAERLISAYFSGAAAEVTFEREELNLDQYRRVRREDMSIAPALSPASGENLALDVSLEEDAAAGMPATEVSPGDTVHALLTDERDIAQYVSKLLGGRSGGTLKALAAPVESVAPEGEKLRFQIRLSGSILGLAAVAQGTRLRVERRTDAPWWRRLLSRGR